jgi:hypothetical protein
MIPFRGYNTQKIFEYEYMLYLKQNIYGNRVI